MILLSYSISGRTPLYGGQDTVLLQPAKCLSKGDSCNTLTLTLPNHAGTHIDCPLHFSAGGRSVTDYAPAFWHVDVAAALHLSDLPEPGSLIGTDLLRPVLALENRHKVRALLLKTGYGRKRHETMYWQSPPGFQPEVADFLREAFPALDFFGFDLISLSSFANREVGRRAHSRFLDRPDPILIIEDMDLSNLPVTDTLDLLVSPFFIEGADGAPCTVWADIGC